MRTFDWPPNFVARCPVKLFEAAGGSNSWQPSGTVGELHMKPLGKAMINFQLHDLLDNQVLFEHTMRQPDAFIVSAERFFVIRLENGSFRGFGFTDKPAANEMKDQVQKAVKPFIITEQPLPNEPSAKETQTSLATSRTPSVGLKSGKEPQTSPTTSRSSVGLKSNNVVSYESIPRRSFASKACSRSKEQPSSPVQPLEMATFTPASKASKFRLRLKVVLKGVASLTQIFGFRGHELEIGYPTDVKHVAHIGWDGPSVTGPGWMDELRPAPDFSVAPLCDFGQPRGPDWIHDALSAAKWTPEGFSENSRLPPAPPLEFQEKDPLQGGQRSNKANKGTPSRQKSKLSSCQPELYRT
eukprot:c27234_g2_i1 orf=291-1355(-)